MNSPLEERITSDLKTAMLSQNSVAISTLRLLKSELKNTEIAQGKPLDESAILQTIRKEVKKRREAIEVYKKVGNLQAEQEEKEAQILEEYLPAQIDKSQVEDYIQSQIAATQATASNKGGLIRLALSHFNGQTDGKTVSEIVNRLVG